MSAWMSILLTKAADIREKRVSSHFEGGAMVVSTSSDMLIINFRRQLFWIVFSIPCDLFYRARVEVCHLDVCILNFLCYRSFYWNRQQSSEIKRASSTWRAAPWSLPTAVWWPSTNSTRWGTTIAWPFTRPWNNRQSRLPKRYAYAGKVVNFFVTLINSCNSSCNLCRLVLSQYFVTATIVLIRPPFEFEGISLTSYLFVSCLLHDPAFVRWIPSRCRKKANVS